MSAAFIFSRWSALAKHVAKFGEAGHRYGGNPAFHQQVHVSFRAAAKFRRHDVRAKKCGVDIERMLLMKFREQRQDFEFALPIEAVAAFRFDGGGAVGGE